MLERHSVWHRQLGAMHTCGGGGPCARNLVDHHWLGSETMRPAMKALSIILLAIGVASGALAQSSDAPAPSTDEFVKLAAIGGIFEMDTSRLALEQSKNP